MGNAVNYADFFLWVLEQERSGRPGLMKNSPALDGLFSDYLGARCEVGTSFEKEKKRFRRFTESGANLTLLEMGGQPLARQRAALERLIRNLVDTEDIPEAAAWEICGGFWQAVYHTQPPAPVSNPSLAPNPAPVPNPVPAPAPAPKSTPVRSGRQIGKKERLLWIGLGLLFVLVLAAALLSGRKAGKTQQRDLSAFGLEQAQEQLIHRGTEDTYLFPDGFRMELYADDSGKEVIRIVSDETGAIQWLFTVRYDENGNPVEQLTFDGSGVLLRAETLMCSPDGKRTLSRRVTDSFGAVVLEGETVTDDNGEAFYRETGADGVIEEYRFDQAGNCISQISHWPVDDGVVYWKYEYSYSQDGRKLRGEDDLGRSYAYSYDEQGRLAQMQCFDSGGAQEYAVTYLYGPWDVEVGETEKNASDGETETYTIKGILGDTVREHNIINTENGEQNSLITYDARGNLLKYEHYDTGDEDRFITEYTYDEKGIRTGEVETWIWDNRKIVTQCNGNGVTLSQQAYDASGSLIEQSRTELDEQGRVKTESTYDANGNMKGYREYGYDAQGERFTARYTWFNADGSYRVTQYQESGAALSWTEYDASGSMTRQMRTELDWNGRVNTETTTDADGKLESRYEYDYDAQGEVSRIHKTFVYSDGSYSNTVTDGNWQMLSEERYDASGNLEQRTQTELDQNGRVKTETTRDSTGKLLEKTQYEYDAQGACTRRTRTFCFPDGRSTVTVYDGDYNMLSRTEYGAAGNVTGHTQN